jgi:hypothetical protein
MNIYENWQVLLRSVRSPDVKAQAVLASLRLSVEAIVDPV